MQNIEQERQSWFKLTIVLLYIFGFVSVTVMAGNEDVDINFDNPTAIALMYVAQVIGVIFLFILPALLFSVFWTKPRIHYLGIAVKPLFSTVILAALGMLLATPLINWLADFNQHMQLPEAFSGIETWMKDTEAKATQLTEAFTKGTSISVLIVNLFVVAFMAALSEELFFRGILQKVLIECTKNKHIGVWVAALLFSAIHMQFYGFIPRMFMGAYLGYLFLWTGSLWVSMIAHFLNNGIAVCLIWLSNRGSISIDADTIGIGHDQWMLVLISIAMVAASLYFIHTIEKKRKNIVI